MDLMGLVHDNVFSPDAVQRRRAFREQRRAAVFSKIGEALGKPSATMKREAGLSWNMPIDPEEVQQGVPVGSQHPGTAALLIVREALADFNLPTKVDLEFKRLRRVSGHGAYAMDEGEVWVGATLVSVSGPRHYIEIPVMVHQGRLLSPGVLVHQGNPRIIAQGTFDDILGSGEFTAKVPDRKNMYAPPPEHGHASREVPRVSPGIWHIPPAKGLVASLIKDAVAGVHQPPNVEHAAYQIAEAHAHDIKKGYLSDDQIESSIFGMSMRYARGDAAAAKKIALLVLQKLREEFAGPDLEHTAGIDVEAGAKEWLAGGALALGLGMAPGMAEAQPQPPSQMQQDPRLGPLFEEGKQLTSSGKVDEAKSRLKELQVKHGPTSPEARAFKAGAASGMKKGGSKKAFYDARTTWEMTGKENITGPQVPGADGTHLDVGERKEEGFMPGQKVKTNREVFIQSRGGSTFRVPPGAAGVVLRDVDGAQRAYMVRLEDQGYAATIAAVALR